MISVLGLLASKGLSLLGDAIVAKGKDAIEEKLGVKLPTTEAELTPEKLLELTNAQNSHEQFLVAAAGAREKVAAEAVTTRWTADMSSDNQFSKNVRPGTLVFLLFLFTVFALSDANGAITIPAVYVALLGEMLKWVFSAYFVGRSTEKVAKLISTAIDKKKG